MSDEGRVNFEAQRRGRELVEATQFERSAEGFIKLREEIEKTEKSLEAIEEAKKQAQSEEDLKDIIEFEQQQQKILDSQIASRERLVELGGEQLQQAVDRVTAENAATERANRLLDNKKKELEQYKKDLESLQDSKAYAVKMGNIEEYEDISQDIENKKKQIEKIAKEIEGKRQKTGSEAFAETGLGRTANTITSGIDSLFGIHTNASMNMFMDRMGDKLGDSFGGIADQLTGALNKLGQALDDSIKDAANFLKDNYTRINADLKGTGLTFNDIQDKAADKLGLNRFVKQTDYLSQIAKLSADGLNFNIEERALLETIKNKSLSTFDANDAAITRLVRFLKQDVTSAQFGIEYTLRNTLNKVFGDTSYLNKLYDNVASTIQDAALAIPGRDITPFNSTVETWLAYMYESGMSEDVVSKIAQGINYLGSGNVSALASNQDLQRLLLLSMDTAGLDYAEILQQGLDVDTTNILMKSIIKYLDEIVNNTKDNLVLQNSYANLFNMSITDMKAIHDIATSDINYLADSSSAIAATYNALAEISNDTLVATQIDNMLDNAKYTYGFDIATNNGKYIAYKVSDLLVNVMQPWTEVKGTIGRVASAANLVGSIGKFAVTALGLTSVARSLFKGSLGSSEGTLGDFLNMDQASYEIATSTMNGQKSKSASTSESTSRLNSVQHVTDMVGNEEDWTRDDHDTLDILKEFEKTIMMSETSKGYAIAVSLEAMNNDVLRSFASIFADEDAMLKTYEGKNNIINKNLFSYIPNDDEVDNDKIKEMAGGGSTTGGASDSSDSGAEKYDE